MRSREQCRKLIYVGCLPSIVWAKSYASSVRFATAPSYKLINTAAYLPAYLPTYCAKNPRQ